jgi:DNA-binding CsgD family transcriptional regulator
VPANQGPSRPTTTVRQEVYEPVSVTSCAEAPELALLEREAELRIGSRRIDAARRREGSVLVVEGPTGIGKTRLLDALANRAQDFEPLRASGAQLESGLQFGIVRDLFGRWLAAASPQRRRRAMCGGAEAAAGVLGARRPKPWRPQQRGAILDGLLALTCNLALVCPLLIVVDDAQWADEASLCCLAYIARRLEGVPALMMLAARRQQPESDAIVELVDHAADQLALAPLSAHATGHLLGRMRPGCEVLADRVHAATAGNPLLVVEVGRALGSHGDRAIGQLAAGIDELLPDRVFALVARRLRPHGRDALALAEAVAVLGPDAHTREAATLAGLDLRLATELAEQLTRAEILAPCVPLAFVQPIVRACVYGSIAAPRRALMHAGAARVLAVRGAANACVADHLLRSEATGEEAALVALRAAGLEAAGSGRPERAAGYLARALSESPPAEQRCALLHELGAAEAAARLPQARSHLGAALAVAADPAARAEAALELTDLQLLDGSFDDARALLDRTLSQLPPEACDLELRLLAQLVAVQTFAGLPRSDRLGGHVPVRARDATAAARTLRAALAGEAAIRGEALAGSAAAVDDAINGGALLDDLGPASGVSLLVLHALQWGERFELAEQQLGRGLGAARAEGSRAGVAAMLALRALSRLTRGALVDAEADAREALGLSRAHRIGLVEPLALAFVLESLLDQGRGADAARELAASQHPEELSGSLASGFLLSARGQLRAQLGDDRAGLRDLMACGSSNDRVAGRSPSFGWRSRAAVIAHRLGRRDEAQRLIAEEVALAERLDARRALAIALRARALISDTPAQVRLLADVVDLLGSTTGRLDHARALCDLGSALRRSGSSRSARGPLNESMQIAHECGAQLLAQRARHELLALGLRPRRHAVAGRHALTERERRVSELAAEGLTNRQIAQAIYVTSNTVEYHLTNSYRKLGIGSRTRLAAVLAAGDR